MKLTQDYRSAKWLMLFVLMFCYFFFYCGRQNLGFAIPGIQQSLRLTAVDTGMISAGLLLFYGVGQVINGSLGDRIGARQLLTLGAILSVAFNFLTSFSTGFWSLLIFWCMNGYAQSLGFAPGSKMIADWWEKSERGKAFGLYLCASGVASIVAFAACIWVLNYFSWRWLFRLPVLLLLFSAVIFYVIARDKPQDLGFPAVETDLNEAPSLTIRQRYRHVFANFRFQMACLSMGFCSVARYGLIVWVPVIYLGAASKHSIWTTIALPIGMALGTIASGSISDKFFNADRIKPTILFMVAASILTIVLYYIPASSVVPAMILLFLSGFFVFGPQSSLFALCPDLLGTTYTSTGAGVMNAYGYAFSAAGEILIGYLVYYTAQVSVTYIVVAASCIIAVLTAWLALPDKSPDRKLVLTQVKSQV